MSVAVVTAFCWVALWLPKSLRRDITWAQSPHHSDDDHDHQNNDDGPKSWPRVNISKDKAPGMPCSGDDKTSKVIFIMYGSYIYSTGKLQSLSQRFTINYMVLKFYTVSIGSVKLIDLCISFFLSTDYRLYPYSLKSYTVLIEYSYWYWNLCIYWFFNLLKFSYSTLYRQLI